MVAPESTVSLKNASQEAKRDAIELDDNTHFTIGYKLDIAVQLLLFLVYLAETLINLYFKATITKELKLYELNYEKYEKISFYLICTCVGSLLALVLSLFLYWYIKREAADIHSANSVQRLWKKNLRIFILDVLARIFLHMFRPTVDRSSYNLFYLVTHSNIANSSMLFIIMTMVNTEAKLLVPVFIFIPNMIKLMALVFSNRVTDEKKDFLISNSGYVSAEFVQSLSKLSSTYSFPIDQVILDFSRSAMPRMTIKNSLNFISIPYKLVKSYKDDAMIGYIASAMQFYDSGSKIFLDNSSLLLSLSIDFLALYMFHLIKQKKTKNTFYSMLGIIRIITSFEFAATLAMNLMTRICESRNDALVKRKGYGEHLIKYISQSDKDASIISNNYPSRVLEVFSHYRSYLARIKKLAS